MAEVNGTRVEMGKYFAELRRDALLCDRGVCQLGGKTTRECQPAESRGIRRNSTPVVCTLRDSAYQTPSVKSGTGHAILMELKY